MKAEIACELCGGAAVLRCEADAAFLCWSCDARVHGANFLVARHARRLLCAECRATPAGAVSGAGFHDVRFFCGACGGGSESDSESSCCSSTRRDSASSGASSGEISSVKAQRIRRRDIATVTEEGLSSWCQRLGIDDCSAALEAFRVGQRRMRAAPRRAVAAGAAWFAAGQTGRPAVLRRLETYSGVPAKVIVAMEERLSRVMRRCHVGEEAEGWGESVDPTFCLPTCNTEAGGPIWRNWQRGRRISR